MNNFVADEERRDGHDGWPRIGRQFYDLWALLGDDRVHAMLADQREAERVMADCVRVSQDFRPDREPPTAASVPAARSTQAGSIRRDYVPNTTEP